MGLFHRFRHSGPAAITAVVHIDGNPDIVTVGGTRYLRFHASEAPGMVFSLAMLPTTPKRRAGELVEITYIAADDGTAVVESMYGAR